MKRLGLLTLALIASLSIATASFAASATVNIVVTITSGDVTITYTSGTDVNIGGLVDMHLVAPGHVSFRNDGDTRADWLMAATDFTDGVNTWTLLGGAPGAATGVNQARLAAVWRPWDQAPVVADYLADDVITTATNACTADAYAVSADAPGVKGYDVDPTQPRDVWFMVDTPAAGSAPMGTPMTSVVTVSAVIGL